MPAVSATSTRLHAACLSLHQAQVSAASNPLSHALPPRPRLVQEVRAAVRYWRAFQARMQQLAEGVQARGQPAGGATSQHLTHCRLARAHFVGMAWRTNSRIRRVCVPAPRTCAASDQSIAAHLLRLRDPHTGQPLSGKRAARDLAAPCCDGGGAARLASSGRLPACCSDAPPRLPLPSAPSAPLPAPPTLTPKHLPSLLPGCSGPAGAGDCHFLCGRYGHHSTHHGKSRAWEGWGQRATSRLARHGQRSMRQHAPALRRAVTSICQQLTPHSPQAGPSPPRTLSFRQAWTLYLVSQHGEVEQKLCAELDALDLLATSAVSCTGCAALLSSWPHSSGCAGATGRGRRNVGPASRAGRRGHSFRMVDGRRPRWLHARFACRQVRQVVPMCGRVHPFAAPNMDLTRRRLPAMSRFARPAAPRTAAGRVGGLRQAALPGSHCQGWVRVHAAIWLCTLPASCGLPGLPAPAHGSVPFRRLMCGAGCEHAGPRSLQGHFAWCCHAGVIQRQRPPCGPLMPAGVHAHPARQR